MRDFREALRSRPVPLDPVSGQCLQSFCTWMRQVGFKEAVDEILAIRPDTDVYCLMYYMATELDDGDAIEYVASLLSPERITPLPLHTKFHTLTFRTTWAAVLWRRMLQLQRVEMEAKLELYGLKIRNSELQMRYDEMQADAADTLAYIKDLSAGMPAVTLDVPVPATMSELVEALKYHPGSRAATESQADFTRLSHA